LGGPGADLSVEALARFAAGWLLSGEISQHSQRTISNRCSIVDNLLWFLRKRRYETCGVSELRDFLAYVTNGHKEPGGRWGNPKLTRPVKPGTVKDYHAHLRTLFAWIVGEGGLVVSWIEI
jgi:hypothetical protein